MTQPTRQEARLQLIVTVMAMAVGGVAFALAGDFVIGVGVGAAVFALARQAMKVWGRNIDHRTDAVSEPERDTVDS